MENGIHGVQGKSSQALCVGVRFLYLLTVKHASKHFPLSILAAQTNGLDSQQKPNGQATSAISNMQAQALLQQVINISGGRSHNTLSQTHTH